MQVVEQYQLLTEWCVIEKSCRFTRLRAITQSQHSLAQSPDGPVNMCQGDCRPLGVDGLL
jgi:hypothetical protein